MGASPRDCAILCVHGFAVSGAGGIVIDSNHRDQRRLRVAWDLGAMQTDLGGIRVAAAPQELPPFAVDGVVVEQDTAQVLGEPEALLEPDESYTQLVREMGRQPRARPGSVVVRTGRPLQLLAIVHDFDSEPSCRAEWIAEALEGIWREVAARGIEALALPPLGCRHGGFDRRRFLALLREQLGEGAPVRLRRLWLVVPADAAAAVLKCLGKAP